MRRILVQVTLAVLVLACADKATSPSKQTSVNSSGPLGASGGGSSSAAPTMLLCANPSGSVFARQTSCHPSEDVLDPVALGLVGPPGPPGTPGISGYELVSHKESVAAGATAQVHVDCPTGKKVISGGFDIETPTDVKVFSSEASDGAGNFIDHGWNVMVQNSGTAARQTTVSAICGFVQ